MITFSFQSIYPYCRATNATRASTVYSIDVHIDTRQDPLFVITPGVITCDVLA